jgi:predicted transcriptional regulator
VATKTSFNLPDEDLAELKRLAEEHKVTLTQALRQAIKDSKFLTEQAAQNTLLIQAPDGEVQRVVIHR